jgi:ribonuclease HI
MLALLSIVTLLLRFDATWRNSIGACSSVLMEQQLLAPTAIGARLITSDTCDSSGQAEYEGLITGLEFILKYESMLFRDEHISKLVIEGDCKTVIDQMSSKATSRIMVSDYKTARDCISKIESALKNRSIRLIVEYNLLPRNENAVADNIASCALRHVQLRNTILFRNILEGGDIEKIKSELSNHPDRFPPKSLPSLWLEVIDYFEKQKQASKMLQSAAAFNQYLSFQKGPEKSLVAKGVEAEVRALRLGGDVIGAEHFARKKRYRLLNADQNAAVKCLEESHRACRSEPTVHAPTESAAMHAWLEALRVDSNRKRRDQSQLEMKGGLWVSALHQTSPRSLTCNQEIWAASCGSTWEILHDDPM